MTVPTMGQNVNKVSLKHCEKKKGTKFSKKTVENSSQRMSHLK